MKRIIRPISLIFIWLVGAGLAQAQPVYADRLRWSQVINTGEHRHRDESEREERGRGEGRAIDMVVNNTRGEFTGRVEDLGDGVYRVWVRIGPRIRVFRVDVRSGSMQEDGG